MTIQYNMLNRNADDDDDNYYPVLAPMIQHEVDDYYC
jgi:hypothetical protein